MSQVVKYLTKLVVTATMVYTLPASNPMVKNQEQVAHTPKPITQTTTIASVTENTSPPPTLEPKQPILKAQDTPQEVKQEPKPSQEKANLPALNPNAKTAQIKSDNQDTRLKVSRQNPSIGVNQPNQVLKSSKTPKGNDLAKNKGSKSNTFSKPLQNNRLLGNQKVVVSRNNTVSKNNALAKKQSLPKQVGSTPKLVTQANQKSLGNHTQKMNQPKGNKLAVAAPATKVTYQVPNTLANIGWTTLQDTSISNAYWVTHLDSIQAHTKQDAIEQFWKEVARSQRPRNVFEKAGRWLRIIPDPQRIAQKELERSQTKQKDSTQTLAKVPKTQKESAPDKQVSKSKKKNRFLGMTMPKVKLGNFLNRFFKANIQDTNASVNQVDTTSVQPKKYPIRELHVGFVYPLSTNGTEAYDYSNRLSIHALLGSAAALDGVEFAGLGNIEKDYVKGSQFAGFFNTVGNSVTGFQAAGFFNNAGSVKGVQAAGFLNMSGVVKSKKYRFNPKNEAVQAAGFGNLNFTDNLRFQGAGFFNIGQQIDGFQGAGFFNVSRKVTGFQGSGFMGIAQQVKGAQISGFMSLAEKAEGLQMAGFLNVANQVKGYQIGFINIADSVSNGIPIGFLSIVKNGYRRWEAWTSESLYANVGYKIGVKEFYNIFAIGGQFLPQNNRWGLGYGIGTIRDLNAKRQLSIEAMAYHINENTFWEERFRLFTQVKFLIGNKKRNSWHFGPTLNLLSSQDVPERGIFASEMPLYQLINRTTNGRNTKFWIGFQAGIRF
ncbi:MAG TPA: hypothetical protein DCS93_24325 [Microscillaceae bacterium]|nr:hypothetical protein [Microscillaceae bacterium]